MRTHPLLYAAIILLVLLVEGFVLYGRFSATTQFSPEQAVAEFRARQADAPAAAPEPGEDPSSPEAQQLGAEESPQAGPKDKTRSVPSPAPACEWACSTVNEPPVNGVYEYFQCGRTTGQCTGEESEPQGTESFGGLSRPFPRRGQRILSTTGANAWNNVHIYAEEHREEFDLSYENDAVLNHRYKVDIKVGPVSGGSDIRMQPPLKFAQFPMSLGQAWSGSFTDLNRESDADYACSVAAREEIRVQTSRVRTWVVDCKLTLKGPKTKGDVNLRFWISPELRNTIQETYDEQLDTPQGPYAGKWMVTLASLTPKT